MKNLDLRILITQIVCGCTGLFLLIYFGRHMTSDVAAYQSHISSFVDIAFTTIGLSLILFSIIVLFSAALSDEESQVTFTIGTSLVATALFVNVLAPSFIDAANMEQQQKWKEIENLTNYGPAVILEQRRNVDALFAWVDEYAQRESGENIWECTSAVRISTDAPDPPQLSSTDLNRYDPNIQPWILGQGLGIVTTAQNIEKVRMDMLESQKTGEPFELLILITLSQLVDSHTEVLVGVMEIKGVHKAAISLAKARLANRSAEQSTDDGCMKSLTDKASTTPIE
ncbi:MAG: hypothetical protein ACPG1C_09035 [Alphaproteobacteria bacterium]